MTGIPTLTEYTNHSFKMMKKHVRKNKKIGGKQKGGKKKGGKQKGGKKKEPVNKIKLHQANGLNSKLYLKLVLKNMDFLPEDIQRVIYKMCLNANMKDWKKEHTKNLKLTNDFLKEVDFPAIEDHYDDSWRKRKGLLGYLEYYGENRDDPMKKWNNIKITRPCHFKYIDKEGRTYLKYDKIETYYLDKSQFKQGVNNLISYNEFTGTNGLTSDFWVGKGCRCLHCDVIRLEYRNQSANSKYHSVPENLRNKYARTTYNPDEEIENRWVTKTKSQAKLDKEMERRKKRNEKINEKKQGQCV